MAAGRHRGRHSRFSRGDQGAPDHAGGRRDSVTERGTAPDFRFVFVRTASEVLRRSSLPCSAAGKNGRGDFSREHRGCVYRNRVEVWHTGSEKAPRVLEQGNAEGWEEADSLGFRGRDQADFADGNEAAGAARHQVRADAWKEERHLGAQGKYSEIYGRRLSGLGLRAGARGVSLTDRYGTRELDSRQFGQKSGAHRRTECRND